MIFSRYAMSHLAKGMLFRRNPIYVQFYVTSRCDLTCKQCNIIYANADVREATTVEVDQIAANLRKIGTSIVLLTGGEPFVRRDLPAIIHSFERRGIHVRTQTNGLATGEMLRAAGKAGAHDISISLDSLSGNKQDFLNGCRKNSWLRAVKAISLVTEAYPDRDSFAAFGTVLSPHNILEIPNIIRFATEIGWYVSLVPAHISRPSQLYNFRSYDREMAFRPEEYSTVAAILKECIQLKKEGYSLYDSEEYLNNIVTFIKGEPIRWRRRNEGRCDSPELYFAIRPNGDLQPCCDHILRDSYPVWHKDFPCWYREEAIHQAAELLTKACAGCMYGSFPEMSITSHFPMTALKRVRVFGKTRKRKPWPLSTEDLLTIIEGINREHPVDYSQSLRQLEPDIAEMREVTFVGSQGSR